MIRVVLPYHLRNLAKLGEQEVVLEVNPPVTIAAVLDALEAAYPVLRGAIREYGNLKRRKLVRFYACAEDISHLPHSTLLPEAVAAGDEPFLVVGAIAGG